MYCGKLLHSLGTGICSQYIARKSLSFQIRYVYGASMEMKEDIEGGWVIRNNTVACEENLVLALGVIYFNEL